MRRVVEVSFEDDIPEGDAIVQVAQPGSVVMMDGQCLVSAGETIQAGDFLYVAQSGELDSGEPCPVGYAIGDPNEDGTVMVCIQQGAMLDSGSAWSPSQLDPLLWIDTAVDNSEWRDESGNGNHLNCHRFDGDSRHLEVYFSHKWGIQLPDGHPYK